MRRSAALIAAVVATGLSLVADPRAEAQPPLRIGASFSETGSLAAMGRNVHRGVQLCVKHANDKGGVLGRRIELLVEDDQSEGATAAAIYEKLITQDNHPPDEGVERESPDGRADGGRGPAQVLRGRGA
jgi:branched-chain amino acid transport system substrate-binding protein